MVISESLKLAFLFVFFKTYLVSAELETIDVNCTKIVLNNGPKYEDNIPYSLHDAEMLVKDPKFNRSKTTLFIPDYYVTQYSAFHPVAEAYYKNGDFNFLQVDWGYTTDDASNVKQPDEDALKTLIAKFIITLLDHIDRKDFNLVAYSTGSSLAANVATEIIAETDGKIILSRLTVLDPPANCMIIKDSALFTDAIHTNAWGHGTYVNVADADFWPNGGAMQPGCTFQTDRGPKGCSHERGGILWSESVANQKTGPPFCSYRAASLTDFFLKLVVNRLRKPEVMGLNCSPNARGNYYLFTKDSSPYALDWCPM